MAKRRKRRRIAFLNRMRDMMKEDPSLPLDRAKTLTEVEVKQALRVADAKARHDKEEHHRVFEKTLFGKKTITTPVKETPTVTPVEAKATPVTTETVTTTVTKPVVTKATTTTVTEKATEVTTKATTTAKTTTKTRTASKSKKRTTTKSRKKKA